MIVYILSKILDPQWRPNWPNEFHFAGSDSEPLLAEDVVCEGIKFLIQRGRVVELVTNGLLLEKEQVRTIVARIDKLSISLDVTNDAQYDEYKMGSVGNKGYSKVIRNIREISNLREKYNSNLAIFVTFVATPKTFKEEEWYTCFKHLDEIGVSTIFVRQDLCNTFGCVEQLEDWVNHIKNNFRCKVNYHAPHTSFENMKFEYCWVPRIWPTLGADGNLYACAHVATTKYEPFANLFSDKSLINLYNHIFTPKLSCLEVSDIGCCRQCPPVSGSFNDVNTLLSMFDLDKCLNFRELL